MASKRGSVGEFSPKLLIFAVVLLSNPIINIFDYFPDFIGCFIIVSALGFFADRAPYFEEARSAFLKLGLVSLAKIPSFIIMMRIISQNLRESDVRVLFTFVFAVIELVLATNAISSLFSALSYLGQRSDAAALIVPFKISGKKSISIDGLRVLCYAFTICKGALNALPEFLLLTNTEAALNPGYFNPALLYPYTILVSVVSIFIFGIIFACIVAKYIKAIYREGKIFSEAEGMIDDARREEMQKKKKVRKMQSFLTVMTVSCFFLFDFASRKLGDVNIIPDFLFGIVLIIAFVGASAFIKGSNKLIISAGAFSAVSITKYVFEITFLNKFTYEQLPISSVATAKYLPTVLISVLEFFLFALLIVLVGAELIKFTKKRTGVSPKNERYGSLDKEYHEIMKKKCIGWAALGISLGAVELTVTLTRGHIRGLTSLSFVFCLIFVSYSYYLFGKIKEEIQNKYL